MSLVLRLLLLEIWDVQGVQISAQNNNSSTAGARLGWCRTRAKIWVRKEAESPTPNLDTDVEKQETNNKAKLSDSTTGQADSDSSITKTAQNAGTDTDKSDSEDTTSGCIRGLPGFIRSFSGSFSSLVKKLRHIPVSAIIIFYILNFGGDTDQAFNLDFFLGPSLNPNINAVLNKALRGLLASQIQSSLPDSLSLRTEAESDLLSTHIAEPAVLFFACGMIGFLAFYKAGFNAFKPVTESDRAKESTTKITSAETAQPGLQLNRSLLGNDALMMPPVMTSMPEVRSASPALDSGSKSSGLCRCVLNFVVKLKAPVLRLIFIVSLLLTLYRNTRLGGNGSDSRNQSEWANSSSNSNYGTTTTSTFNTSDSGDHVIHDRAAAEPIILMNLLDSVATSVLLLVVVFFPHVVARHFLPVCWHHCIAWGFREIDSYLGCLLSALNSLASCVCCPVAACGSCLEDSCEAIQEGISCMERCLNPDEYFGCKCCRECCDACDSGCKDLDVDCRIDDPDCCSCPCLTPRFLRRCARAIRTLSLRKLLQSCFSFLCSSCIYYLDCRCLPNWCLTLVCLRAPWHFYSVVCCPWVIRSLCCCCPSVVKFLLIILFLTIPIFLVDISDALLHAVFLVPKVMLSMAAVNGVEYMWEKSVGDGSISLGLWELAGKMASASGPRGGNRGEASGPRGGNTSTVTTEQVTTVTNVNANDSEGYDDSKLVLSETTLHQISIMIFLVLTPTFYFINPLMQNGQNIVISYAHHMILANTNTTINELGISVLRNMTLTDPPFAPSAHLERTGLFEFFFLNGLYTKVYRSWLMIAIAFSEISSSSNSTNTLNTFTGFYGLYHWFCTTLVGGPIFNILILFMVVQFLFSVQPSRWPMWVCPLFQIIFRGPGAVAWAFTKIVECPRRCWSGLLRLVERCRRGWGDFRNFLARGGGRSNGSRLPGTQSESSTVSGATRGGPGRRLSLVERWRGRRYSARSATAAREARAPGSPEAGAAGGTAASTTSGSTSSSHASTSTHGSTSGESDSFDPEKLLRHHGHSSSTSSSAHGTSTSSHQMANPGPSSTSTGSHGTSQIPPAAHSHLSCCTSLPKALCLFAGNQVLPVLVWWSSTVPVLYHGRLQWGRATTMILGCLYLVLAWLMMPMGLSSESTSIFPLDMVFPLPAGINSARMASSFFKQDHYLDFADNPEMRPLAALIRNIMTPPVVGWGVAEILDIMLNKRRWARRARTELTPPELNERVVSEESIRRGEIVWY